MRMLTCGLLWCLAAQATAAEPAWSQFRGPNGEGSSPAMLAVEFGEGQNVRWKTPIPGKAWSSPVIWENQVWVTNAPEDGKQLSAVCLDRETGSVLHDIVVFELEEPQFCHAKNSYASPTPAIEDGRVYVHYGSHGTACLDTATGRTLWTRQDMPCDHHRGAASSPIIYKNLLVLTYDGFDLQYVVALDKATGKTVWKEIRNIDYGGADGDAKKAYGTPAVVEVDGQPLLISPAAGATIAYAPLSGKEIWKVRHGGMNVAAPPLYGLGKLFISTGDGGFKFFAVRPEGKGDITEGNVDWKTDQAMPSRCAPVLVGELLFFINEAGIASCLDAASGELVWRHRFGGNFSASLLHAGGRVYYCSEEGKCYVVAAEREFNLLAENSLDAGFMASPATDGQALYLRTMTHLYRIENQ